MKANDIILKIYFIIPVYNTEKYLKRCVDSVLAQSYSDTEIVLVDDGSPDSSGKICDSYAGMHKNIEVIHKPNGGLSDARNCGLDYVESVASYDDYVTFLDSDDFVHQNYAEVLVSLCEKYGCGCAQCGYEKGSADSFSAAPSLNVTPTVKSSDDILLDQRLKSQSCAKIYKLSTFQNIRYPLGVLNEDEFVTYRAVYNSHKALLTDEKLYYYYQHNGSIMEIIAKRLKNNPHLFDWLDAYKERISFFEKENKPEQVMRTHEKICTDVILRYCEQMYLPAKDRDDALSGGEYIRLYKKSFPIMFGRKGISFKRRLMYLAFYIFPYSAVLPGKLLGLRK